MTVKRILLAESPDVMPMALAYLGAQQVGGLTLGTGVTGARLAITSCESVDAAMRLLREPCELILCGLHFDGSRMFDLLRNVKADPELRMVPFIAIRTLDGVLDRTFYQSVKIATQALGAAGFIDLYELRLTLGPEQALQRIGRFIDRHVSEAAE